MLDLMHDQFIWPCMAAQVKEHFDKCHPCLTFKAKQPRAALEIIVATHPMELVHLDYLCLEPGKGKEVNDLVVMDHYAQAYVSQSQTVLTTAKALWDSFIAHYWLPKKILLDQGKNFKSELIADICRLMGTKKLRTSPYHPQSNGQCERFNSILMVCWGHYLLSTNQTGRVILEHWSTPTTAPGILPQASIHISSCMEDSPTFPVM